MRCARMNIRLSSESSTTGIVGLIEDETCLSGCGRLAGKGYATCCNSCKLSNGLKHGSRCELQQKQIKQERSESWKLFNQSLISSTPIRSDSIAGGALATELRSWCSLPPELLHRLPELFSHPQDACRVESVCKDWQLLGCDSNLWKSLCTHWYPSMMLSVLAQSAEISHENAASGTDLTQDVDSTVLDWRELFQARYLKQQKWDAKRLEKDSRKKDRAGRERQQALIQDKQRGQNRWPQNQTKEDSCRSVRTKICKRCGITYLPKDNTSTSCTRHSGQCRAYNLDQPTQYTLTGNQVQQAIWVLRRKKKKVDGLAIMHENGFPMMQVWMMQLSRRLDWRWTCCDASAISAEGCVSVPHN